MLLKIRKIIFNILNIIIRNRLTLFLIFIIFCICFQNGLNRATYVDFYPINGDFQNYNVWRRFLDGQIPFKDFAVYLGSGHLVLGSLLTWVLGNSFKLSLIASYFLNVAISSAIIAMIAYLILKNINAALLISITAIVIAKTNFPWVSNFIYEEFLTGLNASLAPGNSARMIRGGAVLLIPCFGMIINSFAKKYSIKNRFLVQSILYAMVSGVTIIYSNDIGIASYISFSLMYFIILLKQFDLRVDIVPKYIQYIILYVGVSFISFLLAICLITRGNLLSWFEFTYSVSQYQSWYYGLTEAWKVYYIHEVRLTPLYYISLFIIAYYLYRIFKRPKQDEVINFYDIMIVYLLVTGLISSILYRIMSGGVSQELLALTTFIVIVAHICKYIYSCFTSVNRFNIKIILLVVNISFIIPMLSQTYINYFIEDKTGVYMDGLDGNLTSLDSDINDILSYTDGANIFSTYASAVETISNDFQPTGTDYIIHVLGDNARKKYMNTFHEGNFQFVQTINRNFTPWELWAESSNWFFYKELYKNYEPKYTTSYSIIWEPSKKKNTFNSNIKVNLERLSGNEFKITCTADSDINGIVDVSINYNSKYKFGFLHNGVIAKYVHITDITRNSMYNNEYVNYFIPPESTGYNIPVTLINGEGEVVISSYPVKDSYLDVIDVRAIETIKNPFIEIQACNLSDNNWRYGINKTSNTVLFSNTSINYELLKNAKSLICNNRVSNINDIKVDAEWIQVTIDNDKAAFAYPNIINLTFK